MKIIYGTDFSPSTTEAGRFAAALARRLGDTLVVAHAVEPPAAFSRGITLSEASIMRTLLERADEKVKMTAAELSLDPASCPESQSLVGRPDEVLAELAERENARLVVVGTHGRTALGRLFIGTVAERLVRRCRLPVLVVPATPARPHGEMKGDRPLKLTVAIERNNSASQALLEFVRGLRATIRCDVSFVHAYSTVEERARLGIEPSYGSPEANAEIEAILERELRPVVAELFDTGGTTSLRMQTSHPGEADPLGRAAALDQADLLVVQGPLRPSQRPRAIDTIRAGSVPVLSICATAGGTSSDEVSALELPIAPWRSVLAATDLSPDGNAAVAEAYRLLAGCGGAVELCLVQDPELRPHAPENWVALQKQLWNLVPSTAELQGIVTRTSILEGRLPAEKILQAGERMGVDALVLGAGHRSGLARARTLMGSVADGVARSAWKPVILVPAARERAAEGNR